MMLNRLLGADLSPTWVWSSHALCLHRTKLRRNSRLQISTAHRIASLPLVLAILSVCCLLSTASAKAAVRLAPLLPWLMTLRDKQSDGDDCGRMIHGPTGGNPEAGMGTVYSGKTRHILLTLRGGWGGREDYSSPGISPSSGAPSKIIRKTHFNGEKQATSPLARSIDP